MDELLSLRTGLMTVSYMQEAATANSFTFLRLLFRWRGSVWKSVVLELLVWLFLFFNVSVIYAFGLRNTNSGTLFEEAVRRCQTVIPEGRTVVIFVLGFYVSHITSRWWNVFMAIPWPDTTAFAICAFLRTRGKKFEAQDKAVRKSIMRYLLLAYVLVFRDVSERIIKRFPTYKHMVPALMTEDERKRLENVEKVRRHWLPLEWSIALLRGCYTQGCLDEQHFCTITQSITKYRQNLQDVLSFDWVNVPLVYVQVVNLCTLIYFLLQCLAAQPLAKYDETRLSSNTTFPIYAVIEFIVFNGWLKTAQVMLNPFGMDDDDFEIDALIERNMMVSYSYVDDFFDKAPKLVNIEVKKLPHTMASAALIGKANPMVGSAANVKVNKAEQRQLNKGNFNKIIELKNIPIPGLSPNVRQAPLDDDNSPRRKKIGTPPGSALESSKDPKAKASTVVNMEEAVQKLRLLAMDPNFVVSAKTQTPTAAAGSKEKIENRMPRRADGPAVVPTAANDELEVTQSIPNSAASSSRVGSAARPESEIKNEIRDIVEMLMREADRNAPSRNTSRQPSRVPSRQSSPKKSNEKAPPQGIASSMPWSLDNTQLD